MCISFRVHRCWREILEEQKISFRIYEKQVRIMIYISREVAGEILAGESCNPFDCSAGSEMPLTKTIKKDESNKSLEKGRIDRKPIKVGSGRCLENREP